MIFRIKKGAKVVLNRVFTGFGMTFRIKKGAKVVLNRVFAGFGMTLLREEMQRVPENRPLVYGYRRTVPRSLIPLKFRRLAVVGHEHGGYIKG